MKRSHATALTRAALTVAIGITAGSVGAAGPMWDGKDRMELTSTTFTNGSALPASAVYNFYYPTGTTYNICSATGATGGDQSPQLAWRHVPDDTRSFVVVAYDTTASFTHWAMYNIPADTRQLPANAGVADSAYGTQLNNDFGDPNYDGPCPPAGVAPDVHHYVFTVYALDMELTLGSPNFPANLETLYQALIHAALEGHVLASAHLVALNSGSMLPAK